MNQFTRILRSSNQQFGSVSIEPTAMLVSNVGNSTYESTSIILLVSGIFSGVAVLSVFVCIFYMWRRREMRKNENKRESNCSPKSANGDGSSSPAVEKGADQSPQLFSSHYMPMTVGYTSRRGNIIAGANPMGNKHSAGSTISKLEPTPPPTQRQTDLGQQEEQEEQKLQHQQLQQDQVQIAFESLHSATAAADFTLRHSVSSAQSSNVSISWQSWDWTHSQLDINDGNQAVNTFNSSAQKSKIETSSIGVDAVGSTGLMRNIFGCATSALPTEASPPVVGITRERNDSHNQHQSNVLSVPPRSLTPTPQQTSFHFWHLLQNLTRRGDFNLEPRQGMSRSESRSDIEASGGTEVTQPIHLSHFSDKNTTARSRPTGDTLHSGIPDNPSSSDGSISGRRREITLSQLRVVMAHLSPRLKDYKRQHY